MVLVLHFVTLDAVAVGRKRRAPHAMAGRAGGFIGLGRAMQGFAVVDGRPRLGKDFGMANGAIPLDPLIVQLMSEHAPTALVVENDGIRRRSVRQRLWLARLDRRGFGRGHLAPGGRSDHEPNRSGQSQDQHHTENNLEGAHHLSVSQQCMSRALDARPKRQKFCYERTRRHASAAKPTPNRSALDGSGTGLPDREKDMLYLGGLTPPTISVPMRSPAWLYSHSPQYVLVLRQYPGRWSTRSAAGLSRFDGSEGTGGTLVFTPHVES